MEVPRITPTRRPHRKSRLGCLQCKQRKVKCDEGKPSCEKCIRYSTACSFLDLQANSPKPKSHETLSPASQHRGSNGHSHLSPFPSPAIQDSSSTMSSQAGPMGRFNMDDMELLFHYTTSTAYTMSHDDLYRLAIPGMAFAHDFLMHAILALSALHLAYLRPEYKTHYLNLSDKHLQVALPAFTSTLLAINQENCHACMGFTMILGIYCWAAPGGNLFLTAKNDPIASPYPTAPNAPIELVSILRGMRAIHQRNTELVFRGPLASLFLPWFEPSAKSVSLPPDLDRRLSDLAIIWSNPQTPSSNNAFLSHDHAPSPNSAFVTREHAAVMDATLPILKRMYALIHSDTNIQDVAAALAWLILIPDAFLKLVQARNPQSLVMLAHYCPLLKMVDCHWWVAGNAERLLASIRDELGEAWANWLEWPLKEVGI